MTKPKPLTAGRCPACHKPLSKKYRRSLTPLEWEKLQVAYWMMAWNREMDWHRDLMRIKAVLSRHEHALRKIK